MATTLSIPVTLSASSGPAPGKIAPLTPPSRDVVFRSPLDDPDWDRRLEMWPDATIFHTAAWARVLGDSYGYRPHYAVIEGKPGEPGSLLPLMEVSSWLTGRRGISLPFTDAVFPLLGGPEDLRALLRAAQEESRSRHWKYIEFRESIGSDGAGKSSTSFVRHSLPLAPDESQLFSSCDDAIRRGVRKAEKSGLSVEFSREPEAMEAFYQLHCGTRQKHGAPPQPYRFFRNIQKQVLAPGYGWIVLARQAERPVAAAVFIHFGKHATYKFGASDAQQLPLRGNNLVMWSAIRRYAGEGFLELDFGRTSIDNKGLRRFKSGWGARETPLDYCRIDPEGGLIPAPDRASGWQSALFRRLPPVVSKLAGSLLYRHIA